MLVTAASRRAPPLPPATGGIMHCLHAQKACQRICWTGHILHNQPCMRRRRAAHLLGRARGQAAGGHERSLQP